MLVKFDCNASFEIVDVSLLQLVVGGISSLMPEPMDGLCHPNNLCGMNAGCPPDTENLSCGKDLACLDVICFADWICA